MDQGPGDLRADIRLTLGRMTRTVDVIAYKVNVPKRLRERVEELRANGIQLSSDGSGPSARERAEWAAERPSGLAALAAVLLLSGLVIVERGRRRRAAERGGLALAHQRLGQARDRLRAAARD